MSISPSWQSILQRIIKVPGERQRLATALGLAAMTLTRWANGESNPQRPHLIRLIQFVQPQYRQELLEALESSYPDIQSWLREDTPDQIPAAFFAEVLDIRTTTTEALRFWRISDLVLKQILTQLDPNGLGMSITLVQCMPPSSKHGQRIRTLRERTGKGTPPWASDLEHLAIFLGMESLAGYAVETRHVVSVEDLRKDKLFPAFQAEFELSAAAHPILSGGRIAGCLSAASTQLNYFSQQRLALLAAFSDLIALAFDKKDFYPSNLVELRVMPSPEKQRPIQSTFRQRVSKTLTENAHSHQRMNNFDAEQKVWRDIEEELLDLPDD